MGSNRFYERAQNLLGGVKKEVGIIEHRGQKGCYYSKRYYINVMIINYLLGKSPHHINSIQDFLEQVTHITLALGECLSSYDVSALFTSVPVDPA